MVVPVSVSVLLLFFPASSDEGSSCSRRYQLSAPGLAELTYTEIIRQSSQHNLRLTGTSTPLPPPFSLLASPPSQQQQCPPSSGPPGLSPTAFSASALSSQRHTNPYPRPPPRAKPEPLQQLPRPAPPKPPPKPNPPPPLAPTRPSPSPTQTQAPSRPRGRRSSATAVHMGSRRLRRFRCKGGSAW